MGIIRAVPQGWDKQGKEKIANVRKAEAYLVVFDLVTIDIQLLTLAPFYESRHHKIVKSIA